MKKLDFLWFGAPVLLALLGRFWSTHPFWNDAFAYLSVASLSFFGLRCLVAYVFKV